MKCCSTCTLNKSNLGNNSSCSSLAHIYKCSWCPKEREAERVVPAAVHSAVPDSWWVSSELDLT